MSFDWERYLDLAASLMDETSVHFTPSGDPPAKEAGTPQDDLTQEAVSEAKFRTAISRAYYAAYHFARDYIEAQGFGAPTKEDSHRWVWERFDPKRPRQESQIKAKGFELNKARKMADYDDDLNAWGNAPASKTSNWKRQSEFAILTARQIRDLIRDIQPHPR